MTSHRQRFTRYDPWYAKVAFGLFLCVPVGSLVALYYMEEEMRRSRYVVSDRNSEWEVRTANSRVTENLSKQSTSSLCSD
jgi:hypothetical protein